MRAQGVWKRGLLVPIRIELLLARHHDHQQRERVEHGDRVALCGEHVRQPAIRVWRLVKPSTAQDHALLTDTRPQHVPADPAWPDQLPGAADDSVERTGAGYHTTLAV